MAGCHLVALSGAAGAQSKNDSDFTILEGSKRLFTACSQYLSGRHKRIVATVMINEIHCINSISIYFICKM